MRRAGLIIICAVIGWYIWLVTAHYFNQRPLWNDEACVFASIKDFTPRQIFSRPLEHMQQFPRVYLWLIQRVSQPFDHHLLALRFLPFACMLAAFGLWVSFFRRQPLFILCWAASIPLIYYGAELKPYSMDVLAGIIFLWFLRAQKDWEGAGDLKAFCLPLGLLPLLGFLSYPAILLMVFPLYNLIVLSTRQERFWPLVIFYTLICAAVVASVYVFDLRVGNAGALKAYWHEYYISFDSVGEFFRSFGEGVNNLISRWFAETPRWIRGVSRVFMGLGFGYLVIGFWRRFKTEKSYLVSAQTMGFAIFLEFVVLGALKQYPFSVPRMALFFCPFLLMATVEALEWLYARQPLAGRILQAAFVAYLVYVSIGIAGVILAGDLGAQSVIWTGVR